MRGRSAFCAACGATFDIRAMVADHIKSWHEGGKTNAENGKMLWRACNRANGGR